MTSKRMQNRVAVITGGASGIGKACAIRLAQEGARIVIADLGADRCEAAAVEVREAAGGQAIAIETDVRSEADIEAMVKRAVDEFGQVDCAVAAAGVSSAGAVSEQADQDAEPPSGELLYLPLEAWNRVLDVNLTGVMLTDRIVARQMVEQGTGGSIVNIASSAARVALPGSGDYNVSKAGVAMLTNVFAMEVTQHQIRVNAVGPGFIDTPMIQRLQAEEEGRAMMIGMTPMGRLGTPEEMADTVLFLACDESSYTTGQTIYPNGGLYVG